MPFPSLIERTSDSLKASRSGSYVNLRIRGNGLPATTSVRLQLAIYYYGATRAMTHIQRSETEGTAWSSCYRQSGIVHLPLLTLDTLDAGTLAQTRLYSTTTYRTTAYDASFWKAIGTFGTELDKIRDIARVYLMGGCLRQPC